MPKSAVRIAAACLLFAGTTGAQTAANSLNPSVHKIVESVSEQRIRWILAKLESFGTRHVMSSQDDPARGIAAAMRWIHDELQSYSPRLQVSYQPFRVRKAGAYARDADLANVIAVLPGTTNPEISILVSGHYDSVNLATRPVPNPAGQAAALIGEARRRAHSALSKCVVGADPGSSCRTRQSDPSPVSHEGGSSDLPHGSFAVVPPVPSVHRRAPSK
jgi:hypothetical protein